VWIFTLFGFLTIGGLICMLYFLAMAQPYGGVEHLPEGVDALKLLMKKLPNFTVYLIFLYNFIVYLIMGRQYFISDDDDTLLSLPFSLKNIILGKFLTGLIFSLIGNLVIATPSLVIYPLLFGFKTLIPFLLLIIISSILGFTLGLLLRHILFLIFPT